MDIRAMTISQGIESVADATRRSRFAYLATIVAGAGIFFAVFHCYYSWDRSHVLATRFGGNPVTKMVQAKMVEDWVSNNDVSSSVLGVRISVSDLPILGSCVLWILSLWMYFSSRRLNHTVAEFLHESRDWEAPERKLVALGMKAQRVFFPTSNNDQPISHWRQHDEPEPGGRSFLRRSVRLLVYTPTLVIGFVLISDLLSDFVLSAPMRRTHRVWREMTVHQWLQWAITDTVALIALIATAIVSVKIIMFDDATTRLIQSYERDIPERDDARGEPRTPPPAPRGDGDTVVRH